MSRDQFIFPKDPSPDVSYLDDGTKVVRACAWSPPGCHSTGCGVKMFIKDGKLVKVEGDPEHPLSRGRLCPRCLAMVEYVYHPDRILYPMKRAREDRGKDKFERISWDEATDIIVSETKRIQQEYGYESVVTYMGTGREAVTYGFIFSSQVLGTPNTCYAQSGWSCMGPRMTAMSMLFGSQYLELDFGGAYEGMWDNPDFTPPEYVFMLGKEPLKSNPDGLWGHSLLELMKTRGTKLINVDPRVSWIGSRADYFLQVKPNSDGALVMALLNVVTQEDLVDHDFIDKWCYGYEELKARAAEYPPSFAAKECGVPEEKIIEVGRILGTKRWSMLIGVATDQNPNGCQVVQGLCDLVAITGNLDVPGGTVMGLNMEFDMDMTTAVPESAQGKTIGWDEYPILPVMLNTTHPDLTLEALETDKPYPLKMAWIDSTNLLSPTCSAQPKRWHDALNRMEFIVAKDTFMNPTIMALADIVLPVSTWAEHNGVVKNNNGCQMGIFGALRGEVQVGEAMGDLEMFIHFGKAFHGKDFKWQSAEEFLDHDLKIHGISWDELKKDVTVQYTLGGYKKYERGMVRPDGQIGFNTPTGRVELYSLRYEALGDDPLPYYKRAPLDPEYNSYGDEYNLHMTTGARHYVSFHSEHRQIKSLRQLHPFPELEIHPKTAEKLGIRDGDDVRVENPWGSALLRAKLTPTIREDTVNADHGWWYPEEDGEEPNLFGVWKSNLNSMVPHKVIGKMGFGAPYKDLPVKVVKANGLTREQDFTTPEALSENKDWEYKNVVNPARSGYASKSSHKSKVEA